MQETFPGSKHDPQLSGVEELSRCHPNISMFTLHIDTLVYNSFRASSKCSKMQVSAFLCVSGARPDLSQDCVQRTSTWWVLIICLLVSRDATQLTRKENSSTSLSSIQTNSCQFLEMALCGLPCLYTNSLPACLSLQTFRKVLIPHHIQSSDMLQLWQDVWY